MTNLLPPTSLTKNNSPKLPPQYTYDEKPILLVCNYAEIVNIQDAYSCFSLMHHYYKVLTSNLIALHIAAG